MSINVDEIRRTHLRTRQGRCTVRREAWPCEALQMADEIEALRKLDPLAIARRVLTADILGEGVHTALRKGCEGGMPAHRAITEMPNEEWGDAMEWVAMGLLSYIEREIQDAAISASRGAPGTGGAG